MKLTSKPVPYSSILGGGIMLLDEDGRARFQIMFMGAADGISKEQNDVLTKQIGDYINEHGLEIT